MMRLKLQGWSPMIDLRYELRNVSKLFKRKYEIVSFPKCGRTWLRFMLGNVFNDYFQLNLDYDDMLELKKRVHYRNFSIPFIEMHHDSDVYKKHLSDIHFQTDRYRGKRIIFMVRDPRDVVVSQYHQLSKRQHIINSDLSSFIRNEKGGLPCIVKFYNEWYRGIGCTREHLILRYEDFKVDTFKELKKMILFFKLDFIPDVYLQQAVEASAFGRMQKMEKNGDFRNDRMSPGDINDIQTFKTRKGKVGGYAEECSLGDIAFMQDYIRDYLSSETGYL